jgi:transposase
VRDKIVCSGCGEPCAAIHDTAERWVDDLAVKEHCPNAAVVYDLFHVVAKYGREVVDRVRVDEANRKLMTVYVLKDDLKELWAYRHTGYAARFWRQWYGRAIRSRIEPLKRFGVPGEGETHSFPPHSINARRVFRRAGR